MDREFHSPDEPSARTSKCEPRVVGARVLSLPVASANAEDRRLARLRRAITVLSVAGVADSSYLLLYQAGTIRHLWCPFFGRGCERISGSRLANPAGIPDALAGVLGYAVLGRLARLGAPGRARRQPVLPLSLCALAAGAVGVSAILTWVQWRRFRTFCFWCLTSAVLSAVIFPLTLPEARRALCAMGVVD